MFVSRLGPETSLMPCFAVAPCRYRYHLNEFSLYNTSAQFPLACRIPRGGSQKNNASRIASCAGQ